MPELPRYVLVQGLPEPSSHLERRDDVVYAKLATCEEALPIRFTSQLPPFATIVAGLERDAFDMRARFARCVDDSTVDRELLRRALAACFAGLYGQRASGPGRASFIAWTTTLPEDIAASVTLDRAPTPDAARATNELVAFGLSWETGHVPADHDSYLYAVGELVPALADAHFEQVVSRERTESDAIDGVQDAYRLRAWLGGTRYEAPADDCGDFRDGRSMIGFVNAMLEKLGDGHRLSDPTDDDVVLIGPREAIAAAMRAHYGDDD